MYFRCQMIVWCVYCLNSLNCFAVNVSNPPRIWPLNASLCDAETAQQHMRWLDWSATSAWTTAAQCTSPHMSACLSYSTYWPGLPPLRWESLFIGRIWFDSIGNMSLVWLLWSTWTCFESSVNCTKNFFYCMCMRFACSPLVLFSFVCSLLMTCCVADARACAAIVESGV